MESLFAVLAIDPFASSHHPKRSNGAKVTIAIASVAVYLIHASLSPSLHALSLIMVASSEDITQFMGVAETGSDVARSYLEVCYLDVCIHRSRMADALSGQQQRGSCPRRLLRQWSGPKEGCCELAITLKTKSWNAC